MKTKKVFLFLLVLIGIMSLSFGQRLTDTEVAKVISQSREYNQQVVDPNMIYPGQRLTYVVEKGDSQWSIVRDKLAKLVKEHGSIIEPEPNFQQSNPVESDVEKTGWPWLVWIFLAIGLVIVFLALTNEKFRDYLNRDITSFIPKKRKSKFSENPAAEGKPFVEGGVKSENAAEHFRTLAESHNPGSDIRIKDVKPVFISTPGGIAAIVEFAGGKKGQFSFRNEPGFSALVSTDGGKTFKKELFFERCGNPVYSRNSMKEQDNLIVTESPINFGDITEVRSPEVSTEEKKPVVVEKPEVGKTEKDSDSYRIQNDQLTAAEKLFEKQKIHKVVQTVTYNSDGGWSSTITIDTKNEPVVENTDKKETK